MTAPSAATKPPIFLTPGTLYCSADPATVGTVLGSCVAVCLLDRRTHAAGMNHYVLPRSAGRESGLRYGDVALARLYAKMLALGSRAGDLQAKVFGGAAVLPFGAAADTVGAKNVEIALEWLRRRAIPVVARRTGGKRGLQIRLHIGSGRVMVREIEPGSNTRIDGAMPAHDSRRGPIAAGER